MCRAAIPLILMATAASWVFPAAAADPGVKCQWRKLGIAGKYGKCRLKAESKAVKQGEAADFTRCDAKFSQKWQAAEDSGGVACPTSGDKLMIEGLIQDRNSGVAACLSGSCLAPSCQLLASGVTSSYASGDDGDIQAGAALAYVDNGDGTITDLNTGLMWEKKGKSGGLHSVDLFRPWSSATEDTIWDWLEDINLEGGTGFANHDDWRIPNERELLTILDFSFMSIPNVDPVFDNNCTTGCDGLSCSCTRSANSYHWSSTTVAENPAYAWGVRFSSAAGGWVDKLEVHVVRAVRDASL